MFRPSRLALFTVIFLLVWTFSCVITGAFLLPGNEGWWHTLLLFPGVIALLPFCISTKEVRLQWAAFLISAAVIALFNLWPLAEGNKTLLAFMEIGVFFFLLSRSFKREQKFPMRALLACSLGAFCAFFFGIGQQWHIERLFHQANICIVDGGGGCGSTCYQYIDVKRCDSGEVALYDLFHGVEQATIKYGYERGQPGVYLSDGISGEKYLLRDGELERN
ncbi:hypothetical protein SOASR030_28170 [Leminorella grimontii]|uniref:Uncharacterized protein n=1 Tax=Leminorella grimontii TaxID=82981 RepID=A0AAV5N560_9GAMM|nr:hypothetical protein [Leminorella grimontii]KFC94608.1 hypothetical protein GLGR_2725 [Leminorella grimontii ATCC 33999 = DSM 5078]GKX56705.1 hypothetical protein SOASR030_28170 [Leminorella grimontii]GKX59695.1 hypothetical protein SOASR031_20100 [Leminorella grimontii]VFS62001.1 Uncharacterised protein [Leminorella grimontii]